MSRYSGKCDFYDHLTILADYSQHFEDIWNVLQKCIVRDIHNNVLHFDKLSDAVPYFPYIIVIGAVEKKEDGPHSTVTLSEESYVDMRRKEHRALCKSLGTKCDESYFDFLDQVLEETRQRILDWESGSN